MIMAGGDEIAFLASGSIASSPLHPFTKYMFRVKLPFHITEQISNLEAAIACRIDSVEGETREQITHVIEGVLNRAVDRIERLGTGSGGNIRPRVIQGSCDTVSEDDFEQARKEFRSIVDAVTAQNHPAGWRGRHLEVLYSRIFEGRTVGELMEEFSLTRSNVKIRKSRGINLIWKAASEKLRRVLLGARPAAS